MAGVIEHAAVFQQELDKAFCAEAATGWMDDNAEMAKYAGGADIKIPKMVLDGLANYSRASGYVEGSISLSYQTMTMSQDRGRGFTLDAMDVDESNFTLAAGVVMGEFQRTKVVPEVDAYRISRIATLATGSRTRALAVTSANILKELKADIARVQDAVGDTEPLVVMMSMPIAALLDVNESVSRSLSVGEFAHGGVTTRVKMLDDAPILRVPSSRMKTAIVLNDGTSGGQTEGGFKDGEGAKAINWIVCAQRAPIGVCKQDTVRIFDPETYQKANAWHIDYRKYHDVWVPEGKLDGIFVNTAT